MDNAPVVRCVYCDELVPQYQYNNHTRINHTPPTAQDLSRLYKKYNGGQKAKASGKNGTKKTPASAAPSDSAATYVPATTSYSAWDAKFGKSNHTPSYVTTDNIASFHVDRSDPPQTTAQSLRKSIKYDINRIVSKFSSLPIEAREECCDIISQMPVFPALSAFVFTHLKVCAVEKTSMVDELHEKIRYWESQGEEWCLLNYKSVKDELMRMLEGSQVDHHVCNNGLLAGYKLHTLDIHDLGALVVMYSSDQDRAKTFYGLKDGQAQAILDLLQGLLDMKSDQLDTWYRRRFLDAVIRLSKKSRCYPQSLLINDVVGRTPTNKRGGFGMIYKGSLCDRVVAVKELHTAGRTIDELMKSISAEAVVWRNVQHVNCLPFYGAIRANEGGSTCLVSPWMEKGNLLEYLSRNPDVPRLPLAVDIASGLEYLHGMQPTIIHGDLKSLNIFVTDSGRACLADFGIASVQDSLVMIATSTPSIQGTRGFVAPELINMDPSGLHRVDRRRCDMFAFGCVMYEMYTGNAPLADYQEPSLSFFHGIRPPRPTGERINKLELGDDVWEFIENLWSREPAVRPVARVAKQFLSSKLQGQDQRQEDKAWDMDFLNGLLIASDPFALY